MGSLFDQSQATSGFDSCVRQAFQVKLNEAVFLHGKKLFDQPG